MNERPPKPRRTGLTEIRGPYYTPVGVRYLDDVLETMGEEVFAWYVKNYGPDVILFVDHSQIVQLECLRSGIWATKSLRVSAKGTHRGDLQGIPPTNKEVQFEFFDSVRIVNGKAEVDSGQLRPGDRVPPERELAVALSVSRATLREAFRVLERAGLIESRIGQGRYVAELRRGHATGNAPSQALEEATILDFLEVRRLLEVPMAGLAARRASSEDIRRIEETISNSMLRDESQRSRFFV